MKIFVYVGNEKEMRKAEIKPGCSDSENSTPTQKRQREDNSENRPALKKARKSTKGLMIILLLLSIHAHVHRTCT
jgi:hypothetical protein